MQQHVVPIGGGDVVPVVQTSMNLQQQMLAQQQGQQGSGFGLPTSVEQMTAQATSLLKKMAPNPPSQPPQKSDPLLMAGGDPNEEQRETIIGAGESDNGVGLCGWLLTMISWGLVLVTLPFSLCVCFKVVQEYERAVIFRLGRLLHGGSRGPGIFFVLPCIESYQKVDLRTITLGVPPQEVLTKDSVTVSVDAVVYYRVSNATVSVANVENAHHSTRLLAQTTLRNILGTKSLHEILSDRDSISGSMQSVLDEATSAWGIKVERVEIKDARLPVQLQRAMAAEAEAAREARAKVIAAEGEQKASRALKEASEIISESSSALQLRYLQTLNSISAEKNSTIIFPLPIDMIKHFLGKPERPSPEKEEKMD